MYGRTPVSANRAVASAPYLAAVAAGFAALGEAILATRFSALVPISISSGCMLSALLLAERGKDWRVALVGFAAIFAALAGFAPLVPAATAATFPVAIALIVRVVLRRWGVPGPEFTSLKALMHFCVAIVLIHVIFEMPLLLALWSAIDQGAVPLAPTQRIVASVLGMIILSSWLVPEVERLSGEAERGNRRKAEFWATMLAVALFSQVNFDLFRSAPFFLILAIVTYLAFRLGSSATALGILIVSGVATETFLLDPSINLGPGGGRPSTDLLLQMFIAACFAVGMSIAVTLADKARLSASLNLSQHELQTVLRATGIVVFRTDAAGRFTYLSPVWEQLMGIPVSKTIGRSILELMTAEDRRDVSETHTFLSKNEIANGRSVRSLRRNDRERVAVEITFHRQIDADGRLAGIDGAMRDITELRMAEAELERTRAELIHASRLSAMGALTSTIAHELNQPLLAVANFARGLKGILKAESPGISPIVSDALDDIDAGVLRAATIVRRMRSLVEKSSVRRQEHSLSAIVTEARAVGLIDAASRGIACQVDLAKDGDTVLVDDIQIQQVLVNLLRNAVEAMEGASNPQIVIRSQVRGALLEVHIADTGCGISKASLADLFKPFATTKRDGMGVGLSLCRTIIEANGGTIWAENRFPSGACFKFTLPRAPAVN